MDALRDATSTPAPLRKRRTGTTPTVAAITNKASATEPTGQLAKGERDAPAAMDGTSMAGTSGPGRRMTDWLDGTSPIAPHEALDRFDALDPIEPSDAIGSWRGQSLPTGHPMDGLLEMLGWYGKIVEPSGRAHPLLFRRPSGAVVALEPAVMPTRVALAWPSVARHSAVRLAFLIASPVLQARRSSARIETRSFRGRHSAALAYDRQPIVDHFRRLDGDRVLGLMTRPGMRQPFLFLLTREMDCIPVRGPAFRSG